MPDAFYMVRVAPKGTGFALYVGPCGNEGTRVGIKVYATVQEAKVAGLKKFKQMPIRVYANEVPFDCLNQVHMALQRIEDRATGHMIVAVASGHYLIRRGRYNTEEAIRYKLNGDFVEARKHEVEPLCPAS